MCNLGEEITKNRVFRRILVMNVELFYANKTVVFEVEVLIVLANQHDRFFNRALKF